MPMWTPPSLECKRPLYDGYPDLFGWVLMHHNHPLAKWDDADPLSASRESALRETFGGLVVDRAKLDLTSDKARDLLWLCIQYQQVGVRTLRDRYGDALVAKCSAALPDTENIEEWAEFCRAQATGLKP